MSRQTGKQYRLPSEAEWSYAAEDSFKIDLATENEIEALRATFTFPGSLKKTSLVGSYPSNAWGIFDMQGNVWEWVDDRFQFNYGDAPRDGSPIVAFDENPRVVRGGTWIIVDTRSPTRFRFHLRPENEEPYIGFRCARELKS